jgi:hypothetical protein
MTRVSRRRLIAGRSASIMPIAERVAVGEIVVVQMGQRFAKFSMVLVYGYGGCLVVACNTAPCSTATL